MRLSSAWSRRARFFLAVGVAAIAGIGAAIVYRHDRATRRSEALHREEVDALAVGHVHLDEGRYRQAIRSVSKVREGSPSEAEALTIRGLAEAYLDEVSPARRDLERAWRLQPNAAAARVLAAIYLSAYETERGLQMLLGASRIDPSDYRPWHAMGELVHLRLRHYEQAIEAFREALKRRPDHVESRVGLADALIKFHRPEEAGPILKGVLDERPDDPRALTLAAEVALELGRDGEAARSIGRTLAIDPDHREALVLSARLRMRQNHPREALAAAERACSLEPNDLTALGVLGSIQAALGQKEQAAGTRERRLRVEQRNQQIEGLMRTILEAPADPEPRCRLGRIAAEAGMRTLAIQSYQAALTVAPDCRPALQGLLALGIRVSPAGQDAHAGKGR